MSANVEQVVSAVLGDLLAGLLAADGLTKEGLLWARSLLADPQTAAGVPATAALELVRLDVDAALARVLGCEPSDLPGSPLGDVGDFPPAAA